MYQVGVIGPGNIAAMLGAGDLDIVTVNELGSAGIESFHTGRRIVLPNNNRTRRIFANG
ncbi:MAG TPA: hypothetical protein VMZ50_12265 [Phycisphaerae bacterium]|nr:hypothetical protein [Phycisphaerae bacterium]